MVNADGTYTYTPKPNFNGTDSFTFTANDGAGGSDTATVTLTVSPVNDAPVAQFGDGAVDEDTTLNGALVATDVDGQAVTYALVTQALHGTVVVNPDGTGSYTPDPDFNGSDIFTYSANDGTAGSNIATVTMTVNPVDYPVNTVPGPQSAEPDTSTPIAGLAIQDIDAGTNIIQTILSVSHGTLCHAERRCLGRGQRNQHGRGDRQPVGDQCHPRGHWPCGLSVICRIHRHRHVDHHDDGRGQCERHLHGRHQRRRQCAGRHRPVRHDDQRIQSGRHAGRFACGDRPGSRRYVHLRVARRCRRPVCDRRDQRGGAAYGPLLDSEQATSHAITIEVTDLSGARFQQSFTIGVANVDPEIITQSSELSGSALASATGGIIIVVGRSTTGSVSPGATTRSMPAPATTCCRRPG